MTNQAARSSFSLDPLMAEAKRRTRQRRLLIAGVLALIAAGVIGGMFASRSSRPPESARAEAFAGRAPSAAVGLVEAKGPAFPVRTFVLTLRNDRRLTVGDVKVTENGGAVVDPTLIPASQASEGRSRPNEYLLQYKSLTGPDKTIRVQVKVRGAGTAVGGYTSPALRLHAARSR